MQVLSGALLKKDRAEEIRLISDLEADVLHEILELPFLPGVSALILGDTEDHSPVEETLQRLLTILHVRR
jgi:hypothetical protein